MFFVGPSLTASTLPNTSFRNLSLRAGAIIEGSAFFKGSSEQCAQDAKLLHISIFRLHNLVENVLPLEIVFGFAVVVLLLHLVEVSPTLT